MKCGFGEELESEGNNGVYVRVFKLMVMKAVKDCGGCVGCWRNRTVVGKRRMEGGGTNVVSR